jgi:hypothetical protein
LNFTKIELSAGNVTPYSYNWNTTSVANGSYTLTAKAYDNAGNIGQSSNISVTVFNDTTAPTITAFSMPATASSTTVAISSFTTTDNAAVTGCLITESATAPSAGATGWTASAPTSFTFSAAGSKTAYAWAKDASGNVSSSRSAAVTIDTTPPVNPSLHAELMPAATLFAGLQDAYNAAANGNTISAQAYKFQENLTFNQPISITLDGGTDGTYLNTTGMTTLQGTLTISQGSLKLKNLIIQNK